MNVRAPFVRRFPRRDRMIHDVTGFVHQVRRLRRIRFRRLFDHVGIHVQKR